MNPSSVPMSPGEFLAFAAVCDLNIATSGEVHSLLTDHYRRDFGSQAVAVLQRPVGQTR